MSDSVLLETERLILRSLTQDDFEDMCRQLSDPDVMRYYPEAASGGALSREGSERWFQGIMRDYESVGYGMLAVCLKESGEYIGQTGVMRRQSDECVHHYLAYLIRKEYWGQGYAIEAVRGLLDYGFTTLGIGKVEAIIRPDNARSIHLAEKLGMQRESTMDLGGHEHVVYALTPG